MGIFKSCSNDKPNQYNATYVSSLSAADGLNLKAVGALFEKSSNIEQFEKKLNSQSEGVNNLDLNEDGKVDYINVSEYGNDNNRGVSLTVEIIEGDIQEVATIEIEKVGKGANAHIRGNEQIYGSNSNYHHHYPSFGSILLYSYLLSPHRMWISPYGYGYYPGYYGGGYTHISVNNYNNKTKNYNKKSNSNFNKSNSKASSIKSPNSNKSARNIKAPLKKPTTTQRSFQKRNPSKVKSGGFGSRSTRSTRSVRNSNRSGGSSWGK